MNRNLRLLHDERGQMLVLSAFVIVALLAFTGLIVDVGFFYAERRQAQNAADQAAKAAAHELSYGGSTAAAIQAALENAHDNGFDNDGVSNTVTVNIPPTSGEFAGQPNHVEAIVTEEPTTFFIHAILGEARGVTARGVATYSASATSGAGYAIFVGNNDCIISDALEFSGSDAAVVGAVHSNAVVKINGSNSTFNGPVTHTCSLDVSGSGNTFDPSPAAVPYQSFPMNHDYSDFPCDMEFTSDTDLDSVGAAWVGGNSSSGQLLPGVYCSTAKLTLSGQNVTGNVTLAAQGGLNISGSDFNLTPYWEEILLFSEDSSSSAIDMSGSGGNWEGIIMALNGLVKVQGSNNLSISGSIIADLVHVSGQDFSLDATNYENSGPVSGSGRLVE